MKGNKAGLADLKRLREKAQASQKAALAHEKSLRVSALADLPAVTQESSRLFALATQMVKPIGVKGRVMHSNAKGLTPDPRAEDRHAQKRLRATGQSIDTEVTTRNAASIAISDVYAPIHDTETEVAWAAPGIGPDTQRLLKQAFWPVGAQLDLHGMTSDQARTALIGFIASCQQHGTRCIRIIHGQGYGSANGQAVLRTRVIQWLTQIPDIAAFHTAPAAHGGRGALLALVRQS